MTQLVSDIETDGLVFDLTKVHCVAIKDAATEETIGYADQPGFRPLTQALERLEKADEIIFHNGISFDIPALQKVYPQFKPRGRVVDTIVSTRVIWPELTEKDAFEASRGRFPGRLIGRQGLEAWGYRLRLMKGDYSVDMEASAKAKGITDKAEITRYVWGSWNREMHDYCIQDVQVGYALWRKIHAENYSTQALGLEHRFAEIIATMERRGFAFDEEAAQRLYIQLVRKRREIADKLTEVFPPKEVTETFIPKVNNKAHGYVKGVPFTKRKLVDFNPSSRQMIADRLTEKGWKPTEFTPSGQAKVDESILSNLPWPEAKVLAEHFLIEKRIGQLAEGDQAWLRVVRSGRIHGSVNPCGTPTSRCTHSSPNVAQVPKVGSAYGEDCRALFLSSTAMRLVGIDLAGIELRCLAHYMARYDGGAYGRAVVEGKEADGTDVHSLNAKALGLDPQGLYWVFGKQTRGRNLAKTFIYAFLYGAGGWKLGFICGCEPEEVDAILSSVKAMEMQRAERELAHQGLDRSRLNIALSVKGQRLKARFLRQTPALARLIEDVKAAAKARGHLKGLDGRLIHIRSPHAALNSLLQTAGALIAKQATVFAWDNLSVRGYLPGRDWALVAHIHDELQIEAKEGIEDEVGNIVVQSMQQTGSYFGFRVPVDGTAKTGRNWADTH